MGCHTGTDTASIIHPATQCRRVSGRGRGSATVQLNVSLREMFLFFRRNFFLPKYKIWLQKSPVLGHYWQRTAMLALTICWKFTAENCSVTSCLPNVFNPRRRCRHVSFICKIICLTVCGTQVRVIEGKTHYQLIDNSAFLEFDTSVSISVSVLSV